MKSKCRLKLTHLQSFKDNSAGEKPITLHIEFYAKPVEVLGDKHVEGMRFERTIVEDGKCVGTGEMFDIDCQMIVPCIGYKSESIEGAKFNNSWGLFDNVEGVMEDNIYVVGWAKRGPSGTIGTNRLDAYEVMDILLEKTKPSKKEGGKALDEYIKDKGLKTVSFADWKKIEAEEEKLATDPTPRIKFAHIDKMMKHLEK